jgi:hypothetical protein
MRGTFDDASLRLAKALRRTPEQVDAALADVGVDAPYLARALTDGDPQGVLDAVSARLGVPQRELVVALLRASGTDPRAAAPPAPHAEALQDFLSRGLPTLLSRAAIVALALGVGLAALASLAFLQPDLFRAALVYTAAALIGVVSMLLLVAAWRMRRAAAALRRGSLARDPSTKR